MTPAGRLRHPITIQQPVGTQNPDTGEILVAWEDVAEEWAAIEGVNGREFLAASADQSETTFRITLRHRTVSPEWRIVSDGVMYSIEAILPDNAKTQLTVMAKTI